MGVCFFGLGSICYLAMPMMDILPKYRGLAVMRPACHLDTQNTVF